MNKKKKIMCNHSYDQKTIPILDDIEKARLSFPFYFFFPTSPTPLPLRFCFLELNRSCGMD